MEAIHPVGFIIQLGAKATIESVCQGTWYALIASLLVNVVISIGSKLYLWIRIHRTPITLVSGSDTSNGSRRVPDALIQFIRRNPQLLVHPPESQPSHKHREQSVHVLDVPIVRKILSSESSQGGNHPLDGNLGKLVNYILFSGGQVEFAHLASEATSQLHIDVPGCSCPVMFFVQSHPELLRLVTNVDVEENVVSHNYLLFLRIVRNLFFILSLISLAIVTPAWEKGVFSVSTLRNLSLMSHLTQPGMVRLYLMTWVYGAVVLLASHCFQKYVKAVRKADVDVLRTVWLSEIPMCDGQTGKTFELQDDQIERVKSNLEDALNDELNSLTQLQELQQQQLESLTSARAGLSARRLCLCHGVGNDRKKRIRAASYSRRKLGQVYNITDSIKHKVLMHDEEGLERDIKELMKLCAISSEDGVNTFVERLHVAAVVDDLYRRRQQLCDAADVVARFSAAPPPRPQLHSVQAKPVEVRPLVSQPSEDLGASGAEQHAVLDSIRCRWRKISDTLCRLWTARKRRMAEEKFLRRKTKWDIKMLKLKEISGSAFVTFRKQEHARLLIEHAAPRCWSCRSYAFFSFGLQPFASVTLRCRPAPHPEDVLWENLHIGHWNRRLRGWGLTILLIVTMVVLVTPATIDWAINPLLDFVRRLYSGAHEELWNRFCDQLKHQIPTLVLLTINSLILPFVIDLIACKVRLHRKSEAEVMQLQLNFWFLVLNSVISPFFGLHSVAALWQWVRSGNWSFGQLPALMSNQFMGKGTGNPGAFGLRYLIYATFLSNAWAELQPHLWIYQEYSMRFARTERERLEAWEPWPFAWGYWYAYFLSLLTLALWMSVSVPLTLPFAFILFAVRYRVDYNNLANETYSLGSAGECGFVPNIVFFMRLAVSLLWIIMGLSFSFVFFRPEIVAHLEEDYIGFMHRRLGETGCRVLAALPCVAGLLLLLFSWCDLVRMLHRDALGLSPPEPEQTTKTRSFQFPSVSRLFRARPLVTGAARILQLRAASAVWKRWRSCRDEDLNSCNNEIEDVWKRMVSPFLKNEIAFSAEIEKSPSDVVPPRIVWNSLPDSLYEIPIPPNLERPTAHTRSTSSLSSISGTLRRSFTATGDCQLQTGHTGEFAFGHVASGPAAFTPVHRHHKTASLPDFDGIRDGFFDKPNNHALSSSLFQKFMTRPFHNGAFDMKVAFQRIFGGVAEEKLDGEDSSLTSTRTSPERTEVGASPVDNPVRLAVDRAEASSSSYSSRNSFLVVSKSPERAAPADGNSIESSQDGSVVKAPETPQNTGTTTTYVETSTLGARRVRFDSPIAAPNSIASSTPQSPQHGGPESNALEAAEACAPEVKRAKPTSSIVVRSSGEFDELSSPRQPQHAVPEANGVEPGTREAYPANDAVTDSRADMAEVVGVVAPHCPQSLVPLMANAKAGALSRPDASQAIVLETRQDPVIDSARAAVRHSAAAARTRALRSKASTSQLAGSRRAAEGHQQAPATSLAPRGLARDRISESLPSLNSARESRLAIERAQNSLAAKRASHGSSSTPSLSGLIDSTARLSAIPRTSLDNVSEGHVMRSASKVAKKRARPKREAWAN